MRPPRPTRSDLRLARPGHPARRPGSALQFVSGRPRLRGEIPCGNESVKTAQRVTNSHSPKLSRLHVLPLHPMNHFECSVAQYAPALRQPEHNIEVICSGELKLRNRKSSTHQRRSELAALPFEFRGLIVAPRNDCPYRPSG